MDRSPNPPTQGEFATTVVTRQEAANGHTNVLVPDADRMDETSGDASVAQVVKSGVFRTHRTDPERRSKDEERKRRAARLLELWGAARRKMDKAPG